MSSHLWNHFIAQSYLKGFSPYYNDEDATKKQKAKVWFYSKKTKFIKLASVEKIGRRPRWYSWRTGKQSYSNEIEEGFSEFEGRYLPVLEKIKGDIADATLAVSLIASPERQHLQIKPQDIAYLASYLCLHVVRIPSFFDKLREMSKERQKEFDRKGLGDISGHGMPGFENTALFGFAVSGLKVNQKIVRIMMNKNVNILFGVTRRYSLMSCDNPVLRKDNFAAFIFPLYQRACIQFRGDGHAIRFIPVRDADTFRSININICKAAQEEIYSSNLEELTQILKTIGEEYRLSTEAQSLLSSE